MIAQPLRRSGHEVDVVAWDAPNAWNEYDLVVIRSTWDYFDRLEEFLTWVDHVDAVSRIVNPPSVVRWNSHKGYLAELGAAGVPVLPSLLVGRGTPDSAARMLAIGWDEVVIKPAVDGGARGALRTMSADPEAAAHLAQLVVDGDVVIQPYAPSVVDGETSVFFFGGELSHAVRKVPKAGDYRVQAMHGGAEVAHTATAAEDEVARAAMALAPADLAYARADFIDVDGQPTLMELELIEPDLFLRASPGAPARFATMVQQSLS